MREFQPTGSLGGWGAPPFEWDLLDPVTESAGGLVFPGNMGWRGMGEAWFRPPLSSPRPRRGALVLGPHGRLHVDLGDSRARLGDSGDFREVVLSVNRVSEDGPDYHYSSWLILDHRAGRVEVNIRLDGAFREPHPRLGEVLRCFDDWEDLRREALVPALLVARLLGTPLREIRQEA